MTSRCATLIDELMHHSQPTLYTVALSLPITIR